MSWVMVDDTLPGHRKLLGCQPATCWLLIASWAWCKHQGTDGAIPREALPALASQLRGAALTRAVAELVRRQWWEVTPEGWQCHDWLQWNDAAVTVEERRLASRERTRAWRSRIAHERRTNDVRTSRVTTAYTVSDAAYTDTDTDTDTKKKIKNPPVSPRMRGEPPGFLNFWAKYPKKVGRRAALEKWRSRRCEPLAPEVVAGLEAGRAYLEREGGQFVPNPATWLHQERWRDEVTGATNGQGEPVDWDCGECGGFHTGIRAARPACPVSASRTTRAMPGRRDA